MLARRTLLAVLAAVLLFVLPATAPAHDAPVKQPTAVGTGGAAATVDAQATQAAIDVLRHGGNAVDAAVAAAGVLGVVEPYSCGIGGGGFMTIYSAKDHAVHTIDSRETAPATMGPDAFTGLTTFESQRVSGMSVGVPGTLRAWETALKEFGTMLAGRRAEARRSSRQARLRRRPDVLRADRRREGDLRRLPGDRRAVPRPRRHAARRRHVDPQPRPRAHVQADRQAGPDALLRRPARPGDRRHRPAPAAARRARRASPRPGVMTLDDLAGYKTVDREPTHDRLPRPATSTAWRRRPAAARPSARR